MDRYADTCQTPGAVYKIALQPQIIYVEVCLPFQLELSPQEAEQLEISVHNALESVFSRYFVGKKDCRDGHSD